MTEQSGPNEQQPTPQPEISPKEAARFKDTIRDNWAIASKVAAKIAIAETDEMRAEDGYGFTTEEIAEIAANTMLTIVEIVDYDGVWPDDVTEPEYFLSFLDAAVYEFGRDNA
jgi:hypothetical protein